MQQILIGIGSGGIFGKGFGQSRQRFGYLVENTAFTDSIFAVILEELGLLGGSMIILSWILFLWRGLKISLEAPDKQGKLLAGGITVWLTSQALLNMAANVGLIPLTGMPLPLLTYGGSSTIVTLIGIAILLNVSKYKNAK
jgi:cell division protein FtsW